MLCKLSDVKILLGINSEETSLDDKLTLFIQQTSSYIEGYIGYSLARKEYVDELHSVNTRQLLQLNHFPIQQVFEVKANGVEITDYKVLPEYARWGSLYRGYGWNGNVFTRGFTHDVVSGAWEIVVNYTAGYYLPDDENYVEGAEDSLPYDIVAVCINCVVEKYNLDKMGAVGLKSHTEGHVSDTFSDSASNPGLSDSAKAALSRFVWYGVT
jgi:hypothetical protein